VAKIPLAIFESFNFSDAVSDNVNTRAKNKARKEEVATEWLDGISRRGLSVDGYAIVYHFPRLLTMGLQVCFYY
jgi:hypothetical protein